jgi:hypothetical protein
MFECLKVLLHSKESLNNEFKHKNCSYCAQESERAVKSSVLLRCKVVNACSIIRPKKIGNEPKMHMIINRSLSPKPASISFSVKSAESEAALEESTSTRICNCTEQFSSHTEEEQEGLTM